MDLNATPSIILYNDTQDHDIHHNHIQLTSLRTMGLNATEHNYIKQNGT
jgi:hypothetical protein